MSGTILLWGLTIAAALITAWRSRQIAAGLATSAPLVESRTDRIGARIAGIFTAVGLHRKLLRKPVSGLLHAMIFTSFIVLFTAILEAFGNGLFPGFSLEPIGGSSWIALLQDIFALVMITGVGIAFVHRHVHKPARFKGSNNTDATLIYGLILAIVISMLLEAAFAILHGAPAGWRPVSGALAALLSGVPVQPQAAEAFFYWVHIAAILGFLIYIPGSKHRHMFLAIPNIFMRNLGPKGEAPNVPDTRPQPGVVKLEDFSWKHNLDLATCTECGRCQEACPAYAAGLPLSPKMLITDLRDAMLDPACSDKPIIGNTISSETLWACTTCRACVDVCPVEIEHVSKIIDLRRTLVEDGNINPGMQDAFTNLGNLGNSLGQPSRQRARWTKGLPFKIKDARTEPVDILWFVGDYASYDPRAQEITRRVALLLDAAGVDFGILYDAEQNSGNDVRRAGEEGLFEMLAQSNIDALEGAQFNRIVTTDPHSLNALRNEYLHLGVSYHVQHYTTLLAELLEQGRLKPRPHTGAGRATYHDPCYLGRYNSEFDAPRTLIAAAGMDLHEMPRCRENSFCCGAGGGRIWQDDEGITERPSENRIREALALGDISVFVTSCPKDKVMYTAAVDALGVADRIEVRDIAEILEIEAPDDTADHEPATDSANEDPMRVAQEKKEVTS